MRLGEYALGRLVGRGASGEVHEARSAAGALVAVKVLHATSAEARARFERERRLLAELGATEGFVPLLDSGTHADRPWLVMPFLAGSLRDRLRRGPLAIDETVALGVALAAALGRAHERGVVHRDLKPENVLFTKEGEPLVADLGLAKHFLREGVGGTSASLSVSGVLRGTAGYAPREQLRDARSVDPRADVFALGAVLHECLAGQPAFVADTVLAVITKVESGEHVRVGRLRGDVPPWLEAVIERALAPSAADRFADGAALARALEAGPRARRGGRRALVAALALVALAALGALVARRGSPSDSSPLSHPPPPHRTPPPTKPAPRRARDPERAVALYQSAAAHFTRDLALAIAEVEEAVAADPELADAWGLLGDLRVETDPEAAIAALTTAIALDPGAAHFYVSRSTAYSRRGESEPMLRDASRAVELDPSSAAAWSSRAWARNERHDPKGALEDATKALALDRGFVNAWKNRGRAHDLLGEWKLASDDYTQALRLAPGDAILWTNRANARRFAEEPRDAIADATKAIELSPAMPEPWCIRGLARMDLDDLEEARRDLRHYSELAPDDPEGRYANLGLLESRRNDHEAAIREYEKALTRHPRPEVAARIRQLIAEERAKLGR